MIDAKGIAESEFDYGAQGCKAEGGWDSGWRGGGVHLWRR